MYCRITYCNITNLTCNTNRLPHSLLLLFKVCKWYKGIKYSYIILHSFLPAVESVVVAPIQDQFHGYVVFRTCEVYTGSLACFLLPSFVCVCVVYVNSMMIIACNPQESETLVDHFTFIDEATISIHDQHFTPKTEVTNDTLYSENLTISFLLRVD